MTSVCTVYTTVMEKVVLLSDVDHAALQRGKQVTEMARRVLQRVRRRAA